jgi:hypothetical protein
MHWKRELLNNGEVPERSKQKLLSVYSGTHCGSADVERSETGTRWTNLFERSVHYIVVSEAHIWRGARAVEWSILLRC